MTRVLNIAFNWSGYAIGVLSLLFLTPFILSSLGRPVYGAWTILVSVASYLGICDLGVRAAMGRHINVSFGKGDTIQASRYYSTAFVVLLILSAVIMIAAVPVSFYWTAWFNVQDEITSASGIVAFVLISLNVCLLFFYGLARAVLLVRNSFLIINAIDVIATIYKTIAIVVVVSVEPKFMNLVMIELSATAIKTIAALIWSRRSVPAIKLRFALANRKNSMELFDYGVKTSVAYLGHRLNTSSDVLIVGAVLGSASAPLYSIPSMVVFYAQTLLDQARSVFYPDLCKAVGRKDRGNLGRIITNLLFAKACLGGLFFGGIVSYGRDFLYLWVGAQYAEHYNVTLVLALCALLCLFDTIFIDVLGAFGEMGLVAVSSVVMGVLNVVLSVLLLRVTDLGLLGVAIASLVTVAGTGILRTIYAARRVGFPLQRVGASGVFMFTNVAICVLVKMWMDTILPAGGSWMQFLGSCALCSLVLLSCSGAVYLLFYSRRLAHAGLG